MQGLGGAGRPMGKEAISGQKDNTNKAEILHETVSFGESRNALSKKLAHRNKTATFELDKLQELKQLMNEIQRYKDSLQDENQRSTTKQQEDKESIAELDKMYNEARDTILQHPHRPARIEPQSFLQKWPKADIKGHHQSQRNSELGKKVVQTSEDIHFSLISNESREIYASLLELEALRIRIEKIRSVLGDIDHREAIVGHTGLRRFIDTQYKAVHLLSKNGMDEIMLKLNAVEDQFSKVFKPIKIASYDEAEMNTIINLTKGITREDLDSFVDHTLALAKNDRVHFEKASLLTIQRSEISEIQQSELREVQTEKETLQQLEENIKENAAVLKGNIENLKNRLSKLR